jgi:leucyl-tRNA---protein transferase
MEISWGTQPNQKYLEFSESQKFSCGYLPNETACTKFVHPNQKITTQTYSTLSEQGFRRSGNYVYTPSCRNCVACVPVRIPVKEFDMRRRHRRTLKHNQDITISQVEPHFNSAHFELYKEYQVKKHNAEVATISPDEYLSSFVSNWSRTTFIEFKLKKLLLAVSVFDRLTNSLSAVYTFYKPELPQRSLGQLAILTQIEIARKKNLSYLYLGYWIENSVKMSYKNRYSPIEYFLNQVWTDKL